MKTAITFIATPCTYESLVTFQTIEQLNDSIYSHIQSSGRKLTETMVKIFKLLGRYSVKYLGVSFLTKTTIGEMIGKSRRTVIRSCLKLEKFGMIKQFEMKRDRDKQQTSNAIVIQPFKKEEKISVTQESAENVTPKNNYSLSNNKNQDHMYSKMILWPYDEFKQMCHCFTSDQKVVSRLYGIYLSHTSYLKDCYEEETLLHIGLLAIKITFQATKSKKIRNIYGYYNGVLNQLLTKLFIEDMKANYWNVEEIDIN